MELKTFADDDFNPKKWINKAWSTSGNQEKEIFVANMVTRLQLYMKQLTNSLDETTTQIVSSIPRILQEASSLQLEGALLQQQLQSLESKVQGVEEQTGHSIASLQRIDQLKTTLENAASALREADKWTALATSLEDILDAGVPTDGEKLNQLCQHVAALSASLEVLSDAPDYETKRLQLETLYNRLEAAVSQPLLDALTKMDAERTTRYVSLLQGMRRSTAAYRWWGRAAGAELAAEWASPASRDQAPAGRAGRDQAPAGRAGRDQALAGLAARGAGQVEWLADVLKCETPVTELLKLYTDVLLSLDPSPTKVFSAALKLCSSPDEGITVLIDLKGDIDEFITNIEALINSPRGSKEVIPSTVVSSLGACVYSSLRELLPHYTELTTRLLLDHFAADQRGQEDLLEQSRALLTLAERCEGWLLAAYNRGKKIAGPAIYPYYAPAVETFITALSSQISAHSRRIESTFVSSTSSGQAAGVLSSSFPASLVLQSAAAVLLDTLRQTRPEEGQEAGVLSSSFLASLVLIQKREKELQGRLGPSDPTPVQSPLHDLPALLLEAEVRQKLKTMASEEQAYVTGLRRIKDHLRGLARTILRSPVDAQLDQIPQLPVWSNNDAMSTDLPDYAISPQEYITEIGQYLMTLPQHLEMHLSDKQAPWQFLSDVCTHTCELYAEKILNIRNMDALGTKRCLTDIVYLSSVVEDLGTNVTPALRNLEKSLRAATPQNE